MELGAESYRETIHSPVWVIVLLYLLAAAIGAGYFVFRGAVAADAAKLLWLWDLIWIPALVCCLLAPLSFARLTVVVERGVLGVRMGLIPIARLEIPLEMIRDAEMVSYQPIRDFGGWGIRCGNFQGKGTTAVYSVRGNTGVLLTLNAPIRAAFTDTTRLLVGNKSHRQLASFLAQRV